MQRITDRIVLLLYCFIPVFVVSTNAAYVVSLLLVVVITSLTYFYDTSTFSFYTTLLYALLAVPFSALYLFLPVILYHNLKYRNRIAFFAVGISVLLYFPESSTLQISTTALGCLLAFILQYKTQVYEDLYVRFKKSQDDSSELYLLLDEKNQTILKRQDYEIYTATLKERNRIAREIHDNVGHMLSRSILMVGALKAINKDTSLKLPLTQLDDTLGLAMGNIRESVHDLHDRALNLKETVDNLVKNFTFCPIQLEYDIGLEIPQDIKYCFAAIMKESLSNIIKHSNATTVQLIVREHPGLYQLLIADNGTVISSNSTNKGIGLANMKDRVSGLRGNIKIGTENGFRIFITIPRERI